MSCRFVSTSDIRYAVRLRVMAESLWQWLPDATITVMCLDDLIEKLLIEWDDPRLIPLTVSQLIERDKRLLGLRKKRDLREFYATLKPLAVRTVAEQANPGELIAVIDSDTCFYSSPEPLFTEMDGHSIGLSPHRFSDNLARLSSFGKFNAGFCLWRSDFTGLRCLDDWHEDCVEWCFNRVDDTRFMNQGYLSEWPDRYPTTVSLQHPGANLAPWNLDNHTVTLDAQKCIRVDGDLLIFFHFSHLFRDRDRMWKLLDIWPGMHQPMPRAELFGSYLEKLDASEAALPKRYRRAAEKSLRQPKRKKPKIDLSEWCLTPTRQP